MSKKLPEKVVNAVVCLWLAEKFGKTTKNVKKLYVRHCLFFDWLRSLENQKKWQKVARVVIDSLIGWNMCEKQQKSV